MKKILFLPLLQMQSGHHQVAEALMDLLKDQKEELTLKKIDILSYTNESLEKMVTNGYLKWIRYAPETYNLAYKNLFYVSPAKVHAFTWYQPIFLKKLERLIEDEKPDLIVCTHGFPSYLLSKLKRKKKCRIPIINVYTDFFINNVWGKEGIDYHFLPTQEMKETLQRTHSIPDDHLIVTGIPVHKEIKKNAMDREQSKRPKIILSGGNSGLGGMSKITDGLKQSTQFDFLVLCGNNQKLYDELLSWNLPHIKPLPYLTSRSEMNRLYEEADAIVTKPGGITISEALKKRLPIFVHTFLPGQEQINLHYLKEKGLVFHLDEKSSIAGQLTNVLQDKQKMNHFAQAVNDYQKGIEIEKPEKIAEIIQSILHQPTNSMPSSLTKKSKVLVSLGMD
ncbi:MGDG synthase family glycosyltransferase [Niallia sp. 03133]|uniref:MGDG synthase family glycosyltransferase n=1 Tax=Niallia sp. 03133 TaxID=3458060 RepID=UPI004043FF76